MLWITDILSDKKIRGELNDAFTTYFMRTLPRTLRDEALEEIEFWREELEESGRPDIFNEVKKNAYRLEYVLGIQGRSESSIGVKRTDEELVQRLAALYQRKLKYPDEESGEYDRLTLALYEAGKGVISKDAKAIAARRFKEDEKIHAQD